ncbi:MAG: phosphotransferase [Caulobacter sp.]|nr:phosphotransferase [Caulobacter sp.]
MSPEQIVRAVSRHFPLTTLRKVEPLKGGVSANVYRLDLTRADGARRSIVLREKGKSGLVTALEFSLLTALHEAGLPTPLPIALDDGLRDATSPFILMSFVEGGSQIPGDHVDPRLLTMAQTLAAVHALPTGDLPKLPLRLDPLSEVLDFLPVGGEWAPLRSHCAALGSSPYQGVPVLLHGDFWPQNLIWNGNRVAAILDWEDAALGDPLSDLACAILELRYLYDDAQVDRFQAAYGLRTEIDPHRLALWQVHVASAAQQYMGDWGLEPAREAHMRQTALRQIREAAEALLSRPA